LVGVCILVVTPTDAKKTHAHTQRVYTCT